MAVTNPSIGAKIITTIGRKGQKPDEYPARVSGQPFSENVNGRTVLRVPVIEEATNLAGEKYLRERVASLFFSFDRSEPNVALDGTAGAPKSMAQLMADLNKQALERLRSLPEGGQELAVDEIAI